MKTALKVKAKVDGFRRAGYKFSSLEDTLIPLADLKKEQIEALKGDPNLLISEVEIDASGNAGNGDGTFNREEAFAYLATQGITPAKNIGDAKLKLQYDAAKSEEFMKGSKTD